MLSVLRLIDLALSIYMWIIIAVVILSWLVAFNIINRHNDIVRQVSYGLSRLTEPVLAPIRRMLPNLGGLDISPLIVIIAIWFLRNLLWEYGPALAMR
jgi:YggT family protein